MPGKLGHDVTGAAQPREGFGTESGRSELPLGKTTLGQGSQVRMGGWGIRASWAGVGGLGIWGQLGSRGEPWGSWGSRETGGSRGAHAEVLHGPSGCPVFSDDVTQLQMQLVIDPFSTVSSQERLFPANTG